MTKTTWDDLFPDAGPWESVRDLRTAIAVFKYDAPPAFFEEIERYFHTWLDLAEYAWLENWIEFNLSPAHWDRFEKRASLSHFFDFMNKFRKTKNKIRANKSFKEWTELRALANTVSLYFEQYEKLLRARFAETHDVASLHKLKGSEAEKEEDCKHSTDFRSVLWHDREYFLNETQASVVEVLWRNRNRKPSELAWFAIKCAAEIDARDLGKVFRNFQKDGKNDHSWDTLIVKTHQNFYRLNPK